MQRPGSSVREDAEPHQEQLHGDQGRKAAGQGDEEKRHRRPSRGRSGRDHRENPVATGSEGEAMAGSGCPGRHPKPIRVVRTASSRGVRGSLPRTPRRRPFPEGDHHLDAVRAQVRAGGLACNGLVARHRPSPRAAPLAADRACIKQGRESSAVAAITTRHMKSHGVDTPKMVFRLGPLNPFAETP
jgi:hypothetical protein